MAVFKCSLFSIAKEKHFHPFPLLTDEVSAKKKKIKTRQTNKKIKRKKKNLYP